MANAALKRKQDEAAAPDLTLLDQESQMLMFRDDTMLETLEERKKLATQKKGIEEKIRERNDSIKGHMIRQGCDLAAERVLEYLGQDKTKPQIKKVSDIIFTNSVETMLMKYKNGDKEQFTLGHNLKRKAIVDKTEE